MWMTPLFAALLCGAAEPPRADSPKAPAAVAAQTSYSDLVDLAESAPLVIRARVRSAVRVEPARAPGLAAGRARLYLEGKTEALLFGAAPVGESLHYLADVPLDAKGKPPALKKKSVLLFARRVAGHPGELQLVAPDAQLAWTAALEAKLRSVLTELVSPAAPRRIATVREAIYVPGALAGEGETQIFLATPDGAPASLTIVHRPGEAPQWSASFSEVLDPSGRPPPHETLAWYRLACFLPRSLPEGANVSESDADKAQAEADYVQVLKDLGDCGRLRKAKRP
ncbi:MAG: hypothetical protein JF593_12365 [Novosphingobium sp.]|nr:hypothetical protein [Novosphingobium sp.]